MEREELKKIVAGLLDKGETLNTILKVLSSEHKVTMTFLDLRLLASEIEEIDWTKNEAPEPESKPEPEEKAAPEADADGKTVVEINRLTRPGVALHGKAKFASGASADWIVDSMGRLGFEKSQGSPTREDLQDFQKELQKALGM